MADNVDLSAIYLGNAADIDTLETNLLAENAADLLGTYGSANAPLYLDRLTLDSDSPSIFIDADHDTGDGTLSYDLGSGPVTVGLDSLVVYNANVTFNDGSSATLEVDVIQLLNGDLFLIAWDSAPVLGSQGISTVELLSVSDAEWAGIAQASFDAVQFVCFAAGTRIDVPGGTRVVEQLAVGDAVTTVDRGPRAVQWIGARSLHFPPAPERQKPIEIKPGALGEGMPRRQLVLSPQHRILRRGPAGEGFLPAVALTGLPGVRRMKGKRAVCYVSLLLERHEVVLAEGLPVESLYPSANVMAVLSGFQRLELLARVPRADLRSYGALARPMLARHEWSGAVTRNDGRAVVRAGSNG